MTIHWVKQAVGTSDFTRATSDGDVWSGECGGRAERDEEGRVVGFAAWSVYSGDHATSILESLRRACARSYADLGWRPRSGDVVVMVGTQFGLSLRGGERSGWWLWSDSQLSEPIGVTELLQGYGPLSQWYETRKGAGE